MVDRDVQELEKLKAPAGNYFGCVPDKIRPVFEYLEHLCKNKTRSYA